MLDNLKALGVQPVGALAHLTLIAEVVLHLFQLIEQLNFVIDWTEPLLPA